MLKKLKGIFVVDDGTAPAPQPTAAKTSKPVATKKKATSTPIKETAKSASTTKPTSTPKSPKSAVPLTGKPDAKFVNVLLKAIEANNEEGFDYLEYKQSLQNLNTMDMDERTKYQSALAMAKTMGVTSTKLISSAKRYVKVLEAEEGKFQQALKGQKTKQVQGREDKIKAHEKAIIEKEAQIEKLQKDIKKHKAELEKIKSEIDAASLKVESTNVRFTQAYQSVKNQILKDITNMEKFLK